MDFSLVISSLRRRLIDALGGGAAFSGSGAAATLLVSADGVIEGLGAGAAAHLAEARPGAAFETIFMADDRVAAARALRSKAVRRLEARARKPGGAAGYFDLHLERRPDGKTVVLVIDRTAERRAALVAAGSLSSSAPSNPSQVDLPQLAELSHEMRTPLNAVIGFAETISAETFGPVGHPNYRQYADHIRMAGRHLLDLVNAVLDLSRLDAERYDLKRTLVDPAAIARECAALVGGAAGEAGLRLTTDIAADVPAAFLDARALRQILLNLLANAVKFTSDGDIHLSLAREDETLVFTVKDDGVGMNAETLAKIGGRFTLAQGAGVRGQGGAGLGLSLAIALAERMGGGLRLASAPGEGLTATLRVPMGAAPAREKVRARADAALTPPAEDRAPSEPVFMSELDRLSAARRARASAA